MSATEENDQTTPTAQTDSQVDLDIAERDFVASMDAIQEYMLLQGKLQGQLKLALMNLARAKYSMGAIGQAQYDNDMIASVRIAVKSEMPSGGRPSFSLSKQKTEAVTTAEPPAAASDTTAADKGPADTTTGGSSGGRAGAVTREEAAATTTSTAAATTTTATSGSNAKGKEPHSDDDDDGGYYESDGEEEEEEEELREANAFLRRMRLQAEGIQEEEREQEDRNGGGSPGKGSGGGHGARSRKSGGVHRRRLKRGGGGDPLHWFGVLVPPALKEAQGQFTAVLDTVVKLANVAQSLPSRKHNA